jgi:hypothetical protein
MRYHFKGTVQRKEESNWLERNNTKIVDMNRPNLLAELV